MASAPPTDTRKIQAAAYVAVRWTTAASFARTAAQLIQVAVLARLLSPADYGLMAIVTAVLSFAWLLSDLGVNTAYIQTPVISHEQRSSLFWLHVATSFALMLLLIFTAPLLSSLFNDERLLHLVPLTAITLVLNALGQQVLASAEKALLFGPVVIAEILSTVIGLCAAVLAAFAGWGVYSLALSGIVTAFVSTLLAWLTISDGWRPIWRLRAGDLKPFLGFGTSTVGSNIVNQINVTMDLFIGGRILSSADLGLYSVPRSLCFQIQAIINPIVTRVGFPLIAQVYSNQQRVRAVYLKTLATTAAINAPLYVGIGVFAPEIVSLLLGHGWDRSADILRILAAWGWVRSTGSPVGSLLLGVGRPDLAFKWDAAVLLVFPPMLWTGSQYGPVGLASTLLLFQIGRFVPAWYFLVRPLSQASFGEYTMSSLRPLLIASLSMIPAALMASAFDGAASRLLVGALVSAPAYVLLSLFGNRQWIGAILEFLGRPSATQRTTL